METAISEAQLTQEMTKKMRITDDFMFNRVMRKADICKEFLEEVLPEIKIGHLEYLETQKSMESNVNKHGIRLDVYSEDEDKVYNIELQRTNQVGLVKRTRYYQSQIDGDLLEKGVDYEELKDCYIIFVCTFDPFGYGQRKYTFESQCQEEAIKLKDGIWKIFLNSKGNKGDTGEDLKVLLDYIENREIEKPTPLVKKIEAAVEEANQDKEWRRQVMIENLKYRDERRLGRLEGIEQGIQQGIQQGMQQGIQQGEAKAKRVIAMNLLKEKLPIANIAQATGLSEAELRQMENENKDL